MIKIPEKCPICGEAWKGGSQKPNEDFKLNGSLCSGRIYYACGCSIFLREYMDTYNLIIRPNGCK